ncbi:MAG: 4'-phosphopantetheinyl transferase superfamily protein [Rhodobacteraceae bacterium]|nr:4'-phosphopantetheinyl transferase superfamily protein [Paracoccaceae bacterium]
MNQIGDIWWTEWRKVDGITIFHVNLTPNARREYLAHTLLDAAEKDSFDRFLSDRARREFVLCRAALRVNIAGILGCSESELSFGHLEFGKPYAKVADRSVELNFNVSHSGRHGLIALSYRDCVGIDLEVRAARSDLDGIGSFVYSREEQRLLAEATGREKIRLFYRLWSMKEALIKALGTGFSLSPSAFEIPEPVLRGARSCQVRFPHLPSQQWQLLDLGERRFAAALAYRSSPLIAGPPIPVAINSRGQH